jgi:hypothetical protein
MLLLSAVRDRLGPDAVRTDARLTGFDEPVTASRRTPRPATSMRGC